jgi:hypothetical protein
MAATLHMQRPRHSLLIFAAVLLASATILTTTCSSSRTGDEPATLVYVGSSDDSWAAMQIVLIELDYRIVSENRDEGKIRAVRDAADSHPASVLTIDQIGRTDTISIFVRASSAPGDPELAADQRDSLASEFLTDVKGLLYK